MATLGVIDTRAPRRGHVCGLWRASAGVAHGALPARHGCRRSAPALILGAQSTLCCSRTCTTSKCAPQACRRPQGNQQVRPNSNISERVSAAERVPGECSSRLEGAISRCLLLLLGCCPVRFWRSSCLGRSAAPCCCCPTRREELVGAPLILKYLTRVGVQDGVSNLYGPTPLAACQVRGPVAAQETFLACAAIYRSLRTCNVANTCLVSHAKA